MQEKRNSKIDQEKWESAIALVQTAGALRTAIKTYGLMSPEVKLAQHRADVALKRYKKHAK
jgi:hypothetical protein